MRLSFKNRIKNSSWQSKALILFLILFLIFHFSVLVKFKHVPAPIYGGDLYRDRGFVQSVVDGYAPWQDGYYLNEWQYYNWLVFALLGWFALFTSFSVNSVFIFYPLLTSALMIVAYYLLGNRLFKDRTYALLTALVAMAFIGTFVSQKGSKVASSVTLPFFLYFFLSYLDKEKIKYAWLAGLFLGLTSLIHGSKYLMGLGMAGFASLFFILKNKPFKKHVKWFSIIFGLGIVISLIYFLPLKVLYNGTPNPVMKYGDIDVSHLGLGWSISSLFKSFVNFSNPVRVLYSFFAVFGLIAFFLNRKQSSVRSAYLWFLPAILLLTSHHLITKPLLDYWVFPPKLGYYSQLMPLFVVGGIIALRSVLKKFDWLTSNKFFIFSVILLVIPGFVLSYSSYVSGKWVQYGMSWDSSTQALYEMGDWIKNNAANDEVILSHDETGFAVMALSGKKVMLTRRTHASYFIDINKRIADASVIFYGNNSQLRRKLLDKYAIEYFYEDSFLHSSPMLTNPSQEDYLSANGVQFIKDRRTLDPAVTPDKGFVTDVLVIPPQNFSQDFRDNFEVVKSIMVGKNVHSLIYRRTSPHISSNISSMS